MDPYVRCRVFIEDVATYATCWRFPTVSLEHVALLERTHLLVGTVSHCNEAVDGTSCLVRIDTGDPNEGATTSSLLHHGLGQTVEVLLYVNVTDFLALGYECVQCCVEVCHDVNLLCFL